MTDLGPPPAQPAARVKADVLAARAQLLARPLEATGLEDLGAQLVGFDAGDGRFVLPTDSIATVISAARPTSVPDQPEWLAGAVAVGGRILTAVEPDRFLGAAPSLTRPSGLVTLIVIADGAAEVALLVDRLASVDAMTTIDPLPDGTPERAARVVRGVVGGRHLLDPAGIVAAIRDALHPSTEHHASGLSAVGAPRS